MNQPEFWKDQFRAKEVSQKLDDLKKEVATWEKLRQEAEELLEIAQLDQADQDVNLRKEAEVKLKSSKNSTSNWSFLLC